MQKLGTSWLLGGVLLCVLLVDLILFGYNQQCSVYVQLDASGASAADDELSAGGRGHSSLLDQGNAAPEISGFKLVRETHAKTKTGI